ncbi:MAG TPA: BREX system ATP-binding domain-containing protein [Caldilineaceae bacterium]|nr:BREX system ATP-binding domain-containing protein [Caldilineaceae bacterium]
MDTQLFVGREAELAELQTHLDKLLTGHGGICFVAGQAGSGKTALVRHFLQRALTQAPDLVVAGGSGNAQTGIGDPYLPFREALALLTGDIAANQAAGKITLESAGRLRTVMVRAIEVLVEVAPELINVLVPGGKLLAHIGQQVVKKTGWMEKLARLSQRTALLTGVAETATEQVRIVEKFTAFLRQLSKEVPLILFFDDLQWADAASINLLFHLARSVEDDRILLIGAYRPNDVMLGRLGQRHPLEPVILELTRYFGDVTVNLDEVPEETNRRFIDALLDAEPNRLGPDFRNALFQQTGGHALFTVELLHAMKKRGDLTRGPDGAWIAKENLDWSALPAKVEGVIAERIARLDDELRELLMVASVEGEEFTAEVVARVEALVEREAIHLLSQELQRRHGLIDAQGLVRIGGLRLSLFRFVHSLFQQYLYNHLGEAERVYLHRDIGSVLEELFGAQTDDVAARLARHFELAGIADKAAGYRLQAGVRACRMSAHDEAATHLQQGLRLLADVPAGPARDLLELRLQTMLGTALVVTHGYASYDVQQAFARARELCNKLDDPQATIPVIFGLGVHYLVSGELHHAEELGSQLLELAQKDNDTGFVLGARLIMGVADMYRGRLVSARAQLEQAVVELEVEAHSNLAHLQGQDPVVAALGFLGLTLWTLGYPDQARRRIEEGLALAQRIGHPYTSAYMSSVATSFFLILGEEGRCRRQAEETLAISQERYPLWQATTTIALGWLQARQGQFAQGLAAMESGLALWEASGAYTSAPYFRAHLAEAYLLARRRSAGLRVLDESFRYTDQGWWLPEQRRLYAEFLLLEAGHEAEAESELRQALTLAQAAQARSLALRAAMSLARLLGNQGRAAEGRERLLACYGWFTEGLETNDLQNARDLLRTLDEKTAAPKDAIGDAARAEIATALGRPADTVVHSPPMMQATPVALM